MKCRSCGRRRGSAIRCREMDCYAFMGDDSPSPAWVPIGTELLKEEQINYNSISEERVYQETEVGPAGHRLPRFILLRIM